tara:strand:+ start:495 stop:1052 length:558 start_codon:yes stop_codon:yes gene_type:complete
VTFIRDLFREMFQEYGGKYYSWNTDERLSNIRIGTVNDHNPSSLTQKLPRILVRRGSCSASNQFLNNGLEAEYNGGINRGGNSSYRQDVSGTIDIIVEATNEGSCEELSEFLRKFICWTKPFIENRFGFQAFCKQFVISPCDQDVEDIEKFKISISIPFIVEDRWTVNGDLTRLNHIFQKLTPTD